MSSSLRVDRTDLQRVADAGKDTVSVALRLNQLADQATDKDVAAKLRVDAEKLIANASTIAETLRATVRKNR